MTDLEIRKATLVDKLKSQSTNLVSKKQFDEVCIVLIDVSESMNDHCENDQSKLANVKQSLPGLQTNHYVSYGLVAFSTEAYPTMHPTTNFHRLMMEADSLLTYDQTNIPAAIKAGLKMLSDLPSLHKRLILMTDGYNNMEGTEMERAIEHCISSQTICDTIAFGKNADISLLQNIAKRTGGIFQLASSVLQLAQSYRNLNYNVRYLENKSN